MHVRHNWSKWALFAAAAGVTGVFFINWCDLIYQCGCTFLWSGASAHCNIRQPGPPDCPWCADPAIAGGALAFTLLVQAAVVWRKGQLTPLRAILAVAASPAAAAAAGWVIGAVQGYWGT